MRKSQRDLLLLFLVGGILIYLHRQGRLDLSGIWNRVTGGGLGPIPTGGTGGGGGTGGTSGGGTGGGTGGGATPSPTGGTDSSGIQWMYADGETTTIAQSRTDSGDHRWSGNVSGLSQYGLEATMIVDFAGASVSSGGHFAMKLGGPNHSGCTSSGSCQWYDFGIRSNGDVQIQTEKPHPDNHTFSCGDVGGCSVSNIGMGMEGNSIGLKWVMQPQSGGNRVMMFYSAPGLSGGQPANNWKLVFDSVDNTLLPGWNPPDEQDCEIRVSDTSGEEAFGGGLHVRKLTGPLGGGSSSSYTRAYSRMVQPGRISHRDKIYNLQQTNDYVPEYIYDGRIA